MKHRPSVAALAARLFALLPIAASCAACAAPLVDVQVIDRASGQQAAIHHHESRLYVAGNPGERYAVRITNRSNQRVMAVLSVDGVNAVTGETAGTNQNGYVLAPYQSYDVPGWRKSQDDVAAFYFTSLGDSYAARTDRPRNVGVIGVAVWREALPPVAVQRPMPYAEHRATAEPSAPPAGELADRELTEDAWFSRDSLPQAGAPAGAAASATRPPPREKLGTGHGERVASQVEPTSFQREGSEPAQLVQIFYDSRFNLVARGIIRDGSASNADPDPFPRHQFVPDPRG